MNPPSYLGGKVDVLVGQLPRTSSIKFFTEGSGDLAALDGLIGPGSGIFPVTFDEDTMTWSHAKKGRLWCEYTSPVAHLLPAECEKARALWVPPVGISHESDDAAESNGPSAESMALRHAASVSEIVLFFASTGEEAMRPRTSLSRALQRRLPGAAVLIVETPYYRSRRPEVQPGHRLLTVGDVLRQCLASALEGALLLRWAHSAFPSALLVTTGFSMGGGLASSVGLLATYYGIDVAISSYAGAPSPRPLGEGVLKVSHAKGAADRVQREAGLKLTELLDYAHACYCVRPFSRGRVLACDIVGFSHDHFVLPERVYELHDLMRPLCPRTRLSFHNGGHSIAFFRREPLQIDSILRVIRDAQEDRSKL